MCPKSMIVQNCQGAYLNRMSWSVNTKRYKLVNQVLFRVEIGQCKYILHHNIALFARTFHVRTMRYSHEHCMSDHSCIFSVVCVCVCLKPRDRLRWAAHLVALLLKCFKHSYKYGQLHDYVIREHNMESLLYQHIA